MCKRYQYANFVKVTEHRMHYLGTRHRLGGRIPPPPALSLIEGRREMVEAAFERSYGYIRL